MMHFLIVLDFEYCSHRNRVKTMLLPIILFRKIKPKRDENIILRVHVFKLKSYELRLFKYMYYIVTYIIYRSTSYRNGYLSSRYKHGIMR